MLRVVLIERIRGMTVELHFRISRYGETLFSKAINSKMMHMKVIY